ncbi:hypothetical protein LINPERPRIM_LOCUS38013 [Linum perenne]
MAGSSSSAPGQTKTWADMVSGTDMDLKFIDIPASAMVGDVLRILDEVIEKSVLRLRSAAVAQFLGTPPPMRVFNSMAPNFYLLEFASEKLCSWVLGRSWHIHNTAMILRKWERGIRPVDFTSAATPVWIEFQGVPPEAITNEGVSWLASKIGKPLNKFVRDGVNIRVCVLRDRAIPCPEKLVIKISKTDRFEVMVVQPKAREYGKTGMKLWRVKSVPKVNESETQIEEGETLKVQEVTSTTPIGLQIIVSDDKAPSTVATEAGGSKSKKKKKAKRKVAVDGGASSVEGHQVSTSLPVLVIGSGNDSASPLGGTEAPVDNVPKQGTGGRIIPKRKLSRALLMIKHRYRRVRKCMWKKRNISNMVQVGGKRS